MAEGHCLFNFLLALFSLGLLIGDNKALQKRHDGSRDQNVSWGFRLSRFTLGGGQGHGGRRIYAQTRRPKSLFGPTTTSNRWPAFQMDTVGGLETGGFPILSISKAGWLKFLKLRREEALTNHHHNQARLRNHQ